MDDDSYLDDLDRKFLSASSALADVFSWTYGMLGGRLVAPIDPNKFDNASSKAAEIGIRALIVLGAALSFVLAATYVFLTAGVLSVGSKIFRAVGFYFQREGFTHIRGKAEEKTLTNEAKVMTWNIRGHGGGLHYAEGGVIHWRSRIDRIADEIQKEDPDVIVLQEIHDPALIEAIVERLENSYAHFYTYLGSTTMSDGSGCMVATKCPVHSFEHHDFTHTDHKTNRGFEIFEIKAAPHANQPCARIIGTQLSPGKQEADLREKQIDQIIKKIAQEKLALPTLFVGSLNINRDDMEESILSKYLYHSYLKDEPTHSDELVSQWAPIYDGQDASSDFVSFFRRNPVQDHRTFPVVERGIRLIDSHLVKGFDENYNTKTALSDHHAVITTFSGLQTESK